MIIALKPQRGDIKKAHKFFNPIHKRFNTAKNGKYFKPFEHIELIEPIEQQLNRR